MHAGWVVVVRGDRIDAAGPAASTTVPAGARTIALTGTTLMPGMIEGHSHLLLHPYNETVWNDQVLREPLALRVARAVESRPRDVDGRHHHRSRSRHRGRRVCGRRPAPGDQRGHHSRPAHAGRRTGDGRHRQLRAERLRAGSDRAAGRGRSRRPRRRRARRARPDRPRRRSDQDLRGLSLGPERRDAAGIHARRNRSASSKPPTAAAGPSLRTHRRPKACAARSWAASTPSSMATKARRRSGS